MNDQIKQLLEQVGAGLLSETEAERRYLGLIEAAGEQEFDLTGDMDGREPPVELPSRPVLGERTVECLNPLENAVARLFVFLPFGFGNETLSWSWRNAFADADPAIEIWLMGASDIGDWERLTGYLAQRMQPLCDLPFAVYGHSMGGIVAYEVLAELERRHGMSPELFIPSAVSPPAVFERLKYLPPVYEIDAGMDMRDCRDLLEKSQIILPVGSGVAPMSDDGLRCDLALIRGYRCRHERPALSCPILALQANNDILMKDAVNVSLWQRYTSSRFGFREIEGSHLYFMNPPRSLFETIRAALCDASRPQSGFKAKSYRLVEFEAGTEEVHIFPYGTHPDGYLIYQSDGGMAAHLWNSARREDGEPAERMLSYLSYTGAYSHDRGVIEHQVEASSDPNFDDDCLTRYYRVEGKTLTLTTAPLTTRENRQSKSNVNCKLVWREVEDAAEYGDYWMVGSWPLTGYLEDGKPMLGKSPRGTLIVTAEGHFSIVAAERDRNRPHYDNLALAGEEEMEMALQSCRSCCGRYAVKEDGDLVLRIEQGLFDTTAKRITLRFSNGRQDFYLHCKPDGADRSTLHCSVRLIEEQGTPMSLVS